MTLVSLLLITFILLMILTYIENKHGNNINNIDDNNFITNTEVDKTYNEVEINKEMYVLTHCIARKSPSRTSSNIKTYNKGDKVTVISKLSEQWYKVDTGNKIGYIQCKCLGDTNDMFIDKAGIAITSVKPDGTILTDGNINDNIVNYAYNYWYMIPENIRNDFKENGWSIILTDKSLSKELDISYPISGVTLTKEKVIKICGNQSSIRYALIHEVGHYIDYRNDFVSRSKTFKKMFNEHGDKILEYNDNYSQASYSEEEYFAELYKAYIMQDYRVKFILSDDIKFIESISDDTGTVEKEKTA